MEITKKQIEKLKENYEYNKQDLQELKKYIDEYGCTDDGIQDATESFEQGWNNAMEFVFLTLGIEYCEDGNVNENEDIIEGDCIIEEICGYCDYVNTLNWDGKSTRTICKGCGEEIKLCCLCDMDECDCDNCQFED